MRGLLALLFFVVSGLIAVSCGSTGEQQQSAAPEPLPAFDSLPGTPGGEQRSVSAEEVIEIDALDFLAKSENSLVDNANLVLDSSNGDPAWGIWTIDQAAEIATRVRVELQSDPSKPYYVAISDYSSGRWDFTAHATNFPEADLDQDRHFSPFNNAHIAVVSADGAVIEVARILMYVRTTGWQVVPLRTEGDVGAGCRIAETDGTAMIVYQEEVSLQDWQLKFLWRKDELGLQQDDWFGLGVKGDLAIGPSLAEVDGKPAISYASQVGNDWQLRYVISNSNRPLIGLSWMGPVIIDSNGSTGFQSSLAVVDGKPAITYRDESNTALRFAWSSSPEGFVEETWQNRIIDNSSDVGTWSSLAVVDGNPAVSYYNEGNGLVYYLRSISPTGSGELDWQQLALVDDAANLGGPTRLLLTQGNPAVFYRDDDLQDLMLTRSSSATGAKQTDWSQPSIIDNSAGTYVENFDVATVDGHPAVAYVNDNGDKIHYSRSNNATGIGLGPFLGWPKQEVHDGTGRMLSVSMAVVDGRVVLCWYEQSAGDLYYAILLE